MQVAVVGTGYVGLVTGCCLAEAGHDVICIDNDKAKVATLRRAKSPIFEPGLEDLISRNIKAGRLKFSSSLEKGINSAQIIFLALPTPPQEDGSADLSYVLSVAKDLGKILPNNYCVIVNKSTVPVGTALAVRNEVSKNAKTEFDVVSNPEFLREGFAVNDFMFPERVVIGVPNKKSEKFMRELYLAFINDESPLIVTDEATAELAKYASNTFLVTKISFMNEMAQLSELMGADVEQLRQIIGSDSRIGHKFLYPGIGAGGSCFPKDIRALRQMSVAHGYDFKLIHSAMTVNDLQQRVLVSKIKDHFSGNLTGKTFALWGLAFKPNTDDIREAPALVIIDELLELGSKIIAYDPAAAENVRTYYGNNKSLVIVTNKYSALDNADALLIATEWPEFIDSDLNKIKEKLKNPLIFDGRNIFNTLDMKKGNFTYYSIGRRPIISKE